MLMNFIIRSSVVALWKFQTVHLLFHHFPKSYQLTLLLFFVLYMIIIFIYIYVKRHFTIVWWQPLFGKNQLFDHIRPKQYSIRCCSKTFRVLLDIHSIMVELHIEIALSYLRCVFYVPSCSIDSFRSVFS